VVVTPVPHDGITPVCARRAGVDPAPSGRAGRRADETAGSLMIHAHTVVVGLLGLEQDAAGFSRLTRKLGLARLTAGRRELRISQTPSVLDGLLWSIIGQQINFAFACVLKRRLIERTGTPL